MASATRFVKGGAEKTPAPRHSLNRAFFPRGLYASGFSRDREKRVAV